jgi:HSP20 family protein
MALAHWSRFRPLMLMRNAMHWLFSTFMRMKVAKGRIWHPGSWTPAVDIYETHEAVILKAEFAGLSKEGVSFEIREHVLLLRGSRPPESEVSEEYYHCMEWASGAFQRLFLLPAAIDEEKVTASYKDGVFKVWLPKAGSANRGTSPSLGEAPISLIQSHAP